MILREKNKSKIEWDEIEYKFSNLKLRFGINQEKILIISRLEE